MKELEKPPEVKSGGLFVIHKAKEGVSPVQFSQEEKE